MYKILIVEPGNQETGFSILRNDVNEFVTFDNRIAAKKTCELLQNVNTKKLYYVTEMD